MQLPSKPTPVTLAVQAHIACLAAPRRDLVKPLNSPATDDEVQADARPAESSQCNPGCIDGRISL